MSIVNSHYLEKEVSVSIVEIHSRSTALIHQGPAEILGAVREVKSYLVCHQLSRPLGQILRDPDHGVHEIRTGVDRRRM